MIMTHDSEKDFGHALMGSSWPTRNHPAPNLLLPATWNQQLFVLGHAVSIGHTKKYHCPTTLVFTIPSLTINGSPKSPVYMVV